MAHSECLLISSVVRTGDIQPAIHAGVTPEVMRVCPHEWDWLIEQYERIGHVPDKAAFLAQWPEFQLYQTDDVAAHTVAVNEAHNRSRLIALTSDVLDLLADGNLDEAMQLVSGTLVSIQASMTEINDSIDIVNEWSEVFDVVEEKVDKVKRVGHAGIPTGWKTLDLNTGGMQEGWLGVVGGRLGHGKTWVMIRMACEAVMAGKTAMYFSLEQSRLQIGMRAQSVLARLVDAPEIRALDMVRGTVLDTAKLRDSLLQIQSAVKGTFLVNDTSRGRIGPMQIASSIERLDEKPDIIYVDYLTLLAMEGEGDWKSVARLSADMKRLGERYEIPVICGSQLNRSAIGTVLPDAGHLSQGDSVGQDADIVVALNRPGVRVMKMGLIKNRHGPDGVHWHARFNPGTGDLEEISGDEAERMIAAEKEAP